MKPDPNKIKAVKQFPVPKTTKNIKQFLGLVGYYRRFIRNMAARAKPLTRLLQKDVPFNWTRECQAAFKSLRDAICTEPILQYPDFTKPFIITTDSSDFAVGAILSQGTIGSDLPIAFASKKLGDAEINYSVTEKELLACVFGVKTFRPYVFGMEFTMVTDHHSLVWLHNVKDPSSRLMRWKVKLEEYNYSIEYKPGRKNSNADALSRNPVESPCNESVKLDSWGLEETRVSADPSSLTDSAEESEETLVNYVRIMSAFASSSLYGSTNEERQVPCGDDSLLSTPNGVSPPARRESDPADAGCTRNTRCDTLETRLGETDGRAEARLTANSRGGDVYVLQSDPQDDETPGNAQAATDSPFPSLLFLESKDHLHFRKDHVAHFVTKDEPQSTQISQNLLAKKRFDPSIVTNTQTRSGS